MKKVEELKDLGCYVHGKFSKLSWTVVHGVSSLRDKMMFSGEKIRGYHVPLDLGVLND